MARGFSRPRRQILNFNCGSKDRREGISRKKSLSGSRIEAFRGRSRFRAGRPKQDKVRPDPLVSFPPLKNDGCPGEDKVETVDKNWVNVFKEPKWVWKEKVLSYFKPLAHEPGEMPFVILSQDPLIEKSRPEAQWSFKGHFQMQSLPGDFFIFRFEKNEDGSKVLWEGPWNFYGRPIVFKEWSLDLEFKKDHFNALPIWMRLPKLDFQFWDLDSIGKIVSVVGHPRFVDDATANRDRLDNPHVADNLSPSLLSLSSLSYLYPANLCILGMYIPVNLCIFGMYIPVNLPVYEYKYGFVGCGGSSKSSYNLWVVWLSIIFF